MKCQGILIDITKKWLYNPNRCEKFDRITGGTRFERTIYHE